MLVDCAVWGPGPPVASTPCALTDALAPRSSKGEFAWIDLRDPTEGELAGLREALGLHDLAVEDALDAEQRPKLEHYDEVWFMVLKQATYARGGEVELTEVQLFVGADFVVTIRHGDAQVVDDVKGGVARRNLASPYAVVHAVADAVVDGYVAIVDDLEVEAQQVEKSVFSEEGDGDCAPRIYVLKREVLELWHGAEPLMDPMEWLAAESHLPAHLELEEYFRDVLDHLRRVVSRLDKLQGLLTDALDANLARLSVRQNEDMRKISAWGALFLLPTVLVGMWGMNFQHMPELDEPWGYPAAFGLIVLCCLLLYRRLRRSGWL